MKLLNVEKQDNIEFYLSCKFQPSTFNVRCKTDVTDGMPDKLGTKVLMPRVDYASLQPCCSLWLFVQLELYSALSLDYAVVVAMSCFCMCYAIQ